MKFLLILSTLLGLSLCDTQAIGGANPFALTNGKTPIFVVMHPNMFEQLGLPKFSSSSIPAASQPIATP